MLKFSILDYGAAANAQLQTEKIQAAIDACFLVGGGEVIVPAGRYRTGGLRLRSNVTLHLMKNAVLEGSRDPKDYFGYRNDAIEPMPAEVITDNIWSPASASDDMTSRDYRFLRLAGSSWQNGLIRAFAAKNISIIGEEGSEINGMDCYDPRGEEQYRGPHAISMYDCKNVYLSGYTVRDSANWAHAVTFCTNVEIENVTAIAGHDGVHFTRCENVSVSNCTFKTGDDCIAGFANVNVRVRDCLLNTACSAFRFGGTNAMITGCKVYGPAEYVFRGSLTKEEKAACAQPQRKEGHRYNMLSLFTYYADYSYEIPDQPGNIVIRDCTVENADRFLHYNFSGNESWQRGRPLSSLRLENIRATGVRLPLTAYGDAEEKFDLVLKNASVAFEPGAEKTTFMHASNFDRIVLDNVTLENSAAEPLIKIWGEGGILDADGLKCAVAKENWIKHTDEPFVCQAI